MTYRPFLSVATAGLLGSTVFAGTMGPVVPSQDWTWVGSLSAGPVWAKAGDTQTFYLAPEIEKTYAATKESNIFASGELFVGIQNALFTSLQGQLGLALATTGNTHLQGIIWDDADPEFNNHSYQYKIQHTHLAVKGKLLMDKGYWLIPWVSGGLGVGLNRAYKYSNTPLIFEALPNPNFSNHTKTAFTYTFGAGVQKALTTRWQVGVGYEFTDWGKSRLGPAFGQILGSGLALNHLDTNGVLVNLTYIA
ncbi:TPA: porin family protein [Legionella pneumophila]|nr:porin family protein [Legionella pneumophila]HAT8867643.1 porin family protein [Legionella pneumophila subsp. pneumophila]HAT7072801.1 porin family protein [Legionella pneumophila]HAT8641370.1 porin family protein [Legionella pneumophila]HAT8888876.1 porin family protein [Legionella pneumophila subsp. pneumophila]HAT8932500.1 porin family protein [Legionella pneumophila subsp. pneumophila]